VQGELPSVTTSNAQWMQVSHNLQRTPNHQKNLRATHETPTQHIPVTTNRFEALTSLSTDLIDHKTAIMTVQEANGYASLGQRKSISTENNKLRNRQIHRKKSPNTISTLVNGSTTTEVSTKHTHRNCKVNTQTTAEHKIMIFGDSHARGLSSKVKNNLDEKYSVCSFVKPGVNIATQISSMTVDTSLLTKLI